MWKLCGLVCAVLSSAAAHLVVGRPGWAAERTQVIRSPARQRGGGAATYTVCESYSQGGQTQLQPFVNRCMRHARALCVHVHVCTCKHVCMCTCVHVCVAWQR